MSNIYPPGQCTWYCAALEPWCMRYGNLGDARDWSGNWSGHGGYVSSVPELGTIACFQPGVDGASLLGHVAVVVAVGARGYTISEMDGTSGPGVVDHSDIPAVIPGVSFLYEQPPSGGLVDMALIRTPSDGKIYLLSGSSLSYIGDSKVAEAWIAAGLHVIDYNDADFASLQNAT